MRLLGFEPRTSWSVAKRSIQLSTQAHNSQLSNKLLKLKDINLYTDYMSNSVVITSAIRTAIGSLGRSLKNVSGDELGSTVISEAIRTSNIKK